MTILPRTDVHQHLWPPELLAALARRAEPPFARREGDAWRLHVPGEPAAAVPVRDGPDRAHALTAQRVDRALLSLSTALEVERLPPREATPLLAAWREVVRELPAALGAWGSVNLRAATPDDVDALLDEGFVGLCLPATALAHPQRIEAVAVMRRAVGAAQLVHGSDTPVLVAGAAPDDEALLRVNPARLLG